MRRSQALVTVFLALLTILAGAPLQAAVPQEMVFQGYLTDSDGNPVDGPRTIKFSMYPSDAGGVAVWTKTVQVDIKNGLLSVLLGGTGLELPDNLFDDQPLWLALKVGNDSEMTPRQPLSAVPWARRAQTADNVPSNGEIRSLISAEGYLTEEEDPSVNALGRAQISCQEGQFPKFLGGAWTCSSDLDLFAQVVCAEDESPVMGANGWYCGPATLLPSTLGGLVITDTRELSLPLGCSDGKVMKFDGAFGRWKCNTDEGLREELDPSVNTLGKAALTCINGQVPKVNPQGKWACAEDSNDLYAAGNGLILAENYFSLDLELLDILYLNEGQSGGVTSAMILNGAVGPDDLAEAYSLASHTHNDAYAVLGHNHDSAYAAEGHNHDTSYAAAGHDHNTLYSAIGHIHDGRYYTESEVDADFAKKAHTHGTTELPTSVAYVNNDQTFTSANIFSGAVTMQGAVTIGTGVTEVKSTAKFTNATAPFTVATTTKVDKLNADLLDGSHSSDFALSAHEHDAKYVNEDQAASISNAMLKPMAYKYGIPAAMVSMFDETGFCDLLRPAGGGGTSQGASVYVTRNATGNCSFYFPLSIPFMSNGRTNTIKTIDVCYYTTSTNATTYISGTYVYAEDADSVTPLASDITNRTGTTSSCYSVAVNATLGSTKVLTLRIATTHSLSSDRIYISHFAVNLEN